MDSAGGTQNRIRHKQRGKRCRSVLAPALAILLPTCSALAFAQGDADLPDRTPINRIQNIGTHNSYHLAPFPGIAALARQLDYRPGGMSVEAFARGFDYAHPSLTEQLQRGLRHFEIDVYDDPQGGRFADSGVYALLRERGLLPKNADQDPQDKLKQPGIKVFHLPETDFRSTCLLFRECLREIKRWSDKHRYHVPVMIQIEVKEQSFPALNADYPDVAVLPWQRAAWQRLEEEILAVFPHRQVLTPDRVRGDYNTLFAAITDRGWPRLGDVRGRVFFTLDNRGPARDAYLDKADNLSGRLLFVDVEPGHPAAAFMVINDPFDERIPERVAEGYLIRTRADAGTIEARQNDYRRRNQAFASGAQFISTDYPLADQRFSDYRVIFADGQYVRVNNP